MDDLDHFVEKVFWTLFFIIMAAGTITFIAVCCRAVVTIITGEP